LNEESQSGIPYNKKLLRYIIHYIITSLHQRIKMMMRCYLVSIVYVVFAAALMVSGLTYEVDPNNPTHASDTSDHHFISNDPLSQVVQAVTKQLASLNVDLQDLRDRRKNAEEQSDDAGEALVEQYTVDIRRLTKERKAIGKSISIAIHDLVKLQEQYMMQVTAKIIEPEDREATLQKWVTLLKDIASFMTTGGDLESEDPEAKRLSEARENFQRFLKSNEWWKDNKEFMAALSGNAVEQEETPLDGSSFTAEKKETKEKWLSLMKEVATFFLKEVANYHAVALERGRRKNILYFPLYFLEKFHELRNDKEFMVAVMIADGRLTHELSDELRNDKEFMMGLVTTHHMANHYVNGDFNFTEWQLGLADFGAPSSLFGSSLTGGKKEPKEKWLPLMKEVANFFMKEVANFHAVALERGEREEDDYDLDGFPRYFLEKFHELKNDKEFMLAVLIASRGEFTHELSDELKNGKEFVMAAVAQDCFALRDASAELKNDKEVVMAAVTQNGRALEDASAELKNDKELVMAAVAQNGWALEDASAELKNDKEVVMAAMAQDGWALQYASDELKNDKEVVMAAVAQNGRALKYASAELKKDKEIVMAAVAQNDLALEYASDELKNDKEVVMAAMAHSWRALKYASEELRNDKEMRKAEEAHYQLHVRI
jgi:hypothetical protein